MRFRVCRNPSTRRKQKIGKASLPGKFRRIVTTEYFVPATVNRTLFRLSYRDRICPATWSISIEKTAITFPEKKRNLIYIYLESVEMTYADKKSGGALEYNCIPELTKLAIENDCFNGNNEKLNGAKVSFGATYTMGGMVAQSSGLPVVGGIGNA